MKVQTKNVKEHYFIKNLSPTYFEELFSKYLTFSLFFINNFDNIFYLLLFFKSLCKNFFLFSQGTLHKNLRS